MEQGFTYSGVGTHHQNGAAKNAIHTVVIQAHTMKLHAALHWPQMTDAMLWPMALSHSAYLGSGGDLGCAFTPYGMPVTLKWGR